MDSDELPSFSYHIPKYRAISIVFLNKKSVDVKYFVDPPIHAILFHKLGGIITYVVSWECVGINMISIQYFHSFYIFLQACLTLIFLFSDMLCGFLFFFLYVKSPV